VSNDIINLLEKFLKLGKKESRERMNVELLLLREYKRLGILDKYKEQRQTIINTLHKDNWSHLALEVSKELAEEKNLMQELRIELEDLSNIIEEPKVKANKFT
jgi:hypothetical protein